MYMYVDLSILYKLFSWIVWFLHFFEIHESKYIEPLGRVL